MSDILNKVAELYDKLLLEWIRKGRPVLSDDGTPKIDAKGKPIRVPLSAADLSVIRARLRDCQVGSPMVEGGTIDQLNKELATAKGKGLKLADLDLPAVSQLDDAATGTHGR